MPTDRRVPCLARYNNREPSGPLPKTEFNLDLHVNKEQGSDEIYASLAMSKQRPNLLFHSVQRTRPPNSRQLRTYLPVPAAVVPVHTRTNAHVLAISSEVLIDPQHLGRLFGDLSHLYPSWITQNCKCRGSDKTVSDISSAELSGSNSRSQQPVRVIARAHEGLGTKSAGVQLMRHIFLVQLPIRTFYPTKIQGVVPSVAKFFSVKPLTVWAIRSPGMPFLLPEGEICNLKTADYTTVSVNDMRKIPRSVPAIGRMGQNPMTRPIERLKQPLFFVVIFKLLFYDIS
ncbi:hypothetical protein BDQ12DRAFT_712144 [Crucibulum laeve]|uniref:Uncharacterized protein n=1 Tax=Crucibulum laeve TaxID=68775 RepID=A0A5C3M2F8_9AGAR|nr:hypothetical protein BDQ12DRAFT_712144 [Crucibulum laeve]